MQTLGHAQLHLTMTVSLSSSQMAFPESPGGMRGPPSMLSGFPMLPHLTLKSWAYGGRSPPGTED